MGRSLFPGLRAFCLPHSPANSTILIHLLRFYTPSTTPLTPHFISIVSRQAVVLLLFPLLLALRHSPSHPSSTSSPRFPSLPQCSHAEMGCLPNRGLIPCSNSLGGHPSISSSFPAVLGKLPAYRSQACSHTLQLQFIACWSTTLNKFPSKGAVYIRLSPTTLAGKLSDYSKLGCWSTL